MPQRCSTLVSSERKTHCLGSEVPGPNNCASTFSVSLRLLASGNAMTLDHFLLSTATFTKHTPPYGVPCSPPQRACQRTRTLLHDVMLGSSGKEASVPWLCWSYRRLAF